MMWRCSGGAHAELRVFQTLLLHTLCGENWQNIFVEHNRIIRGGLFCPTPPPPPASLIVGRVKE